MKASYYYTVAELARMNANDLECVCDEYGIPYDEGTPEQQMRDTIHARQGAHFDRVFRVEMHAFCDDNVLRLVYVPSSELTGDLDDDLGRIFYWGQNDFQNVAKTPSVSVGDVIQYGDNRYEVMPFGFRWVAGEVEAR